MASIATDQTHTSETMRKRIQLLATLVATATYAAGFSPPGGVWPETAGHNLPGDPIIRSTQYVRYLIFFYCNATTFASSFMVFALIIFLMTLWSPGAKETRDIPLLLVTLVGLLSLTGAYASGTFQDVFTAVFTSLLVAGVFTYLAVEGRLACIGDSNQADSNVTVATSSHEVDEETHNREVVEKHNREVLMQLATFALTVTYGSGLNTPGGFWDSADGGNRPGDTILKGARPTVFFVCNTMAFVASLLMVLVLLLKKIRRMEAVNAGSVILLLGLLGSYLAGSCQETDTIIYMASLIGVVVAYIIFVVVVTKIPWKNFLEWLNIATTRIQDVRSYLYLLSSTIVEQDREERVQFSYVEYLSTAALTITYVAGLHPPGGLWQDDGDGHKAGDPILQTTNLRRYNAFFYCNSAGFVASLVCMILVQLKPLLWHQELEQAMIVDLLGLVGSYAFGSCRAGETTLYTAGMGGAALVYVVLHVGLLDYRIDTGRDRDPDRMGFGFFVFATFVATTTYQAGLTPPGGFLLKDDESGNHAGDPVLLHNYPRRYRVFFYCNSASLMVSIAILILLVNRKLYMPAIKTHALSVCTAVSFFCLLAAFAAGTTQHLDSSIYVLVLLAVVFCSAVLLIVLLFYLRSRSSNSSSSEPKNAAGDANQTTPTSSEGNAHHQPVMSSCSASAQDNAPASNQPIPIDELPPPTSPSPTKSSSSEPTNAAGDANPTIPTSSEGNVEAEEDAARRVQQAKQAEEDAARARRAEQAKREQAKRIYMMTVGILVAGVTYQAGLDPPGGSWPRSSDRHDAGSPVMHSNRRQRYLLFFLSNSAAFVASIFLMLLLLLTSWTNKAEKPLRMFMKAMILLGFLGLLGAYATGSNRDWKASVHVVVLFFSVLAYFSFLLVLSLLKRRQEPAGPSQTNTPCVCECCSHGDMLNRVQ